MKLSKFYILPMVLLNHPNEALEDKKAAFKCEYTRMAEGDDKLYRKSFVVISTAHLSRRV